MTVNGIEGQENEPSQLDIALTTLGDALAEYALRSLHTLMSRLVYGLNDGLPVSYMLQVSGDGLRRIATCLSCIAQQRIERVPPRQISDSNVLLEVLVEERCENGPCHFAAAA